MRFGPLGGCAAAEALIATGPTAIMFRSGLGDAAGPGQGIFELWQFFPCQGYTLHVQNRVAHNDGGLSREGPSRSTPTQRRTTSHFAIRVQRHTEIRDRPCGVSGNDGPRALRGERAFAPACLRKRKIHAMPGPALSQGHQLVPPRARKEVSSLCRVGHCGAATMSRGS